MEKLYLGVARELITPEVGCNLYGYRPDVIAESVSDDLTATAFCFQQGSIRALMISLTLGSLQCQLAERLRSLIRQKTGIPEANCMLSCTHTHSAPNTTGQTGWGDIDRKYCENILVPAVLRAAEQAAGSLQAVYMGVAAGNSYVGINRRELREDNTIALGQNPWGCFNPKMTIISFVDEQNIPVANMVHYGAHGTAAGTNHEVSQDWPGPMVRELEKQSNAVTAFFNGPEGDVGPRLPNGRTTGGGDIRNAYALGAVAAQDAVAIYRQIFQYTQPKLTVSEKALEIPVKSRIPFDEAKAELEKYRGQTVNLSGGVRAYLEDVIASYEAGYQEITARQFSQTVIALGDVVFAAFPYEVFSEIGMRIDRAVPGKSVLSLSNTNGSKGYFITQDAICRGGYEVTMFRVADVQPFRDDADYYLMKETVNHIHQMITRQEG